MLDSARQHGENTNVYVGMLCFLLFFLPQGAGAGSLQIRDEGINDSGLLKLSVFASTDQKNPFNAASALISYPQNIFEVVEIDTSQSIFPLWSAGPREDSGTISFSGGTPAKGGFIFDGKLLSVYMKIKDNGAGKISIDNGELLASDGLGSNILSHTEDYRFRIETAVSLEFDTSGDGIVSIEELSIALASKS